MKYLIRAATLAAIIVSVGAVLWGAEQHERAQTSRSAAPQAGAQMVPPYHKSAAEARPLPRILPASEFSDRPLIARAYEVAAQIPTVLAQQPCYCNCDKEFGHTSLLDCFASSHTAGCGICMGETFFTYQMTKDGKSPSQIRAAIIRGDWKTTRVDPFK